MKEQLKIGLIQKRQLYTRLTKKEDAKIDGEVIFENTEG